ncbi:D-alanine--poly(phosphoribitol) ligase subunit 2 [Paenibacillaceae bacterium GAS479]|nr:D-alanine--poly(phosphoribitol) ligase subunit 2 [Paenibacillaceae bacterium GAS479]
MTVPQVSTLEQVITKKLSEVFNRAADLDFETDLRNEGLDSIKTIEFIVNLEVEFDIQIDDQDLLVENFSTINKVTKLLSEKYGVQP